MGLKSDLYDVLVENLGEEYVNNSSEGQKKVDKLAGGLAKAITEYMKRQDWVIVEMNAPVMTGAGPGMASLSRTGKGMTGMPLEPINTYTTKVKVGSIHASETTDFPAGI